jgi:hypothetical protein
MHRVAANVCDVAAIKAYLLLASSVWVCVVGPIKLSTTGKPNSSCRLYILCQDSVRRLQTVCRLRPQSDNPDVCHLEDFHRFDRGSKSSRPGVFSFTSRANGFLLNCVIAPSLLLSYTLEPQNPFVVEIRKDLLWDCVEDPADLG